MNYEHITMNIVVVLESPFSGDIPRNIAYGQRIMADSRERGEIVIMPHLLWTQHHEAPEHFVSDYDTKYDIKNGGREESLEQIKILRGLADKVIFYTDYGMSSGMEHGLEDCKTRGIKYEMRQIGNLHQDEENKKSRDPSRKKSKIVNHFVKEQIRFEEMLENRK